MRLGTMVVTFKDPDAVHEAVRDHIRNMTLPDGLTDEEERAIHDVRKDEIDDIVRGLFTFGEYVDIEVDLDAKTTKIVT